ncbi:hypothetical protein TNCT_98761 [Trichonephila clavata]|uniref:Uncharacterized protein n=1 Tax=Trichonephila clavata TaxID=2740835 RepID=A0A8X6KH05_TRICU|nr:hypothetical protein TNCT_98761 [Trichonephila clavata]
MAINKEEDQERSHWKTRGDQKTKSRFITKSCDSRRKIYLVQKVLPERSCPYDLSSRRPFTEKQEQIRKGRVLSFKSRSKGATIKETLAERRSPSVQDQSENCPTVEALNGNV